MPPKFSDFFIARVSADVAQAVEIALWRGAGGVGSNDFKGLTTLFAEAQFGTDGGQTIVPTAVTASNVIAELGKVVDAIPSALYGKEDMQIYISQNVARAYVRALGGFGSFLNGENNSGVNTQGTMWYQNGGSLSFDGVKLVTAHGLADDRMVAAQKSNLFFGTGLLSDQNEVKIIDMADIDGSKNVRFVMRYTAGVQYGIASDIVYYGA
jgi:hypothetical protein